MGSCWRCCCTCSCSTGPVWLEAATSTALGSLLGPAPPGAWPRKGRAFWGRQYPTEGLPRRQTAGTGAANRANVLRGGSCRSCSLLGGTGSASPRHTCRLQFKCQMWCFACNAALATVAEQQAGVQQQQANNNKAREGKLAAVLTSHHLTVNRTGSWEAVPLMYSVM